MRMRRRVSAVLAAGAALAPATVAPTSAGAAVEPVVRAGAGIEREWR